MASSTSSWPSAAAIIRASTSPTVCLIRGRRTRSHSSAYEKGGHMAGSIETWRDLLENPKAYGHLATLMPDGTPQVTPVWVDYERGKVLVNSCKGRTKVRNLKVGSPVAI